MTPQQSLELQRLLSALCDGELTAEQQERLNQWLQEDAECRRLYLEYVDMHARLLARPQLASAAEPAARPMKVLVPQPLRYAIVAAATLAASLLIQAWWLNPAPRIGEPISRPAAMAPPQSNVFVATLTHAAGCVWDPPEHGRDGSRLVPGDLRLREGVARLRFDSGPELAIEGPAHLHLDSSASATVLRGRVFFRGHETAAPFKLKTPTSTLIDLGTEYAVVVGPGVEEVYVLDGEVERTGRAFSAEAQHLGAGDGRRYTSDADSAGQPAEFDPAEFERLLSDATTTVDAGAGLLAYEGFQYDDATLLPAGAAAGGTGWSSPWRPGFARPRNAGDTNVLALNVKQGLARTGAAEPSAGGAFDYSGFSKYFRRMAVPVRMDTDDVYYVSFLLLRDGPPDESLNSSAILLRTDYELELEHQGQENRRERLNLGVDKVNHLFTALHGVGARIPLPMSYGETYLLVAKIAASSSNPDQVFIRVYAPEEPVDHEETSAWTMVGPQFFSNLVFDWLEVHVNSCSRKALDEIRVGRTWSSVAAPWVKATVPAEAEQGS